MAGNLNRSTTKNVGIFDSGESLPKGLLEIISNLIDLSDCALISADLYLLAVSLLLTITKYYSPTRKRLGVAVGPGVTATAGQLGQPLRRRPYLCSSDEHHSIVSQSTRYFE